MKSIVVIGGMGSGKSTVVSFFREIGLSVIDLDCIGHKVLEFSCVKERIASTFGQDFIDGEGQVIRSSLACTVFSSRESLCQLDSITLPLIKLLFCVECESLRLSGVRTVVVEQSVCESKADLVPHGDLVVLAVVAPLDDRVARAEAAGWDREDVLRRISLQCDDEARRNIADFVFVNDGSVGDLMRSVRSWWVEHSSCFEL